MLAAIARNHSTRFRLLLRANACTEPNGNSSLLEALRCGRIDLATVLLDADCDASVLRLLIHDETFFVDERFLKEIKDFVEGHRFLAQEPRRLKQLCRMLIRRCLGRGYAAMKRIKALPLPKPLHEYLSLKAIKSSG